MREFHRGSARYARVAGIAEPSGKEITASPATRCWRTHTLATPWPIVRADDKHRARLGVIKDLLTHLDYENKEERVTLPDPETVFVYDEAHRIEGLIAP